MKKRLLSLFLALVMLVSLIPTTAFALHDGDSGYVRVTNVDVRAGEEMVGVTLDADTDIDCNLVFAGYSESGKLLVSAARKVSAYEHGPTFGLSCKGLSSVGSLATVKVFALGPDNRLLGIPYETQAYSANPTRDGYTYGDTVIAGTGAYAGHTLRIWYQNENIISWLDGEFFVTVPDLICVFDLDNNLPQLNPFARVGEHVAVTALPAAKE